MNVNLYVIEDYENETAFRPKKNKPKQTQFQIGRQMSDVCLLSSVLCSRMSDITCLRHLQFIADSDIIAEHKRLSVSLAEMTDRKFQLNEILGVKKV